MKRTSPDVLVIGAGPSALAIIVALCEKGVHVEALANTDPKVPWPYTYGIWGNEVDELGMQHLLEHRWRNTVSYFGSGSRNPESQANAQTNHGLDYGLFDKVRLQSYWLNECEKSNVNWHLGEAKELIVDTSFSNVKTSNGKNIKARLVIDATGYKPVFLAKNEDGPIAIQTCYGIVAKFNRPPVKKGQFVLMDYRNDHLSDEEKREPPTFLYAMDMGDDSYFLEETSLGLSSPYTLEKLKNRLNQRIEKRGLKIIKLEHEEIGLYLPMNMPLPDLKQNIFGFGGAAGMVHPASGYMFGSILRRAPLVAEAIATKIKDKNASPSDISKDAWNVLWTPELQKKQALYKFGLEKLMRFSDDELREFFEGFFSLPTNEWYGFLTNTLELKALIISMIRMFIKASWKVKLGLMKMQGREIKLLWRFIRRYKQV